MSQRSLLKWPGAKIQIIGEISPYLPPTARLIEPFVGAGSIFLNTNYDRYLLNDINPDLINLFKIIKKKHLRFIRDLAQYFTPAYNCEQKYYECRTRFRSTTDTYEKALLFVYLNRHGFNGLCRYNKSKGEYNVPFGRYSKVYFPKDEIIAFAHKSKHAVFTCKHFKDVFKSAQFGSVVYCDPPFYPRNSTSSFTGYAKEDFSIAEQQLLVELAEDAKQRGITTIISNHSIPATHKLYSSADITKEIDVKRTISARASSRKKVKELVVSYLAEPHKMIKCA